MGIPIKYRIRARESADSEAIRLALRGRCVGGQTSAIEYQYGGGKARSGPLSLHPSWCVSRLISSW